MISMSDQCLLWGRKIKGILLMIGMAMFAARMAEDGVIKIGGAELGRAILKLVPSMDCNLRNAFFRL